VADGGGHQDHKGHKDHEEDLCVCFVIFEIFVIFVAAAVGPSQSLSVATDYNARVDLRDASPSGGHWR